MKQESINSGNFDAMTSKGNIERDEQKDGVLSGSHINSQN